MRTRKYNNTITKYKGIKYDSKKEVKFVKILEGLKKSGEIKAWRRQVRFPLPDINYIDKKSKRSYYLADFVVLDKDNYVRILEVKGYLTSANKIKYSFFQFVHKTKLHIIQQLDNLQWLSYPEKFKCSSIREFNKLQFFSRRKDAI